MLNKYYFSSNNMKLAYKWKSTGVIFHVDAYNFITSLAVVFYSLLHMYLTLELL